jgi:uncharacterized protein (DUF58 family)
MNDRLQDILRRVRRLELRARGKTREELAGEYHTRFKGQGIDFADHRAYLAGDDVRAIDWNVTARMPEPYIRTFVEERELTLYLLVDVSPSLDRGTGRLSKRELAAELAATLAFSALRNNDKTGLILFSREVELLLPAARGRTHVLRVLREILSREAGPGLTRPAAALDALRRAVPKRSLVFLISDMAGEDFERALKPVARRHDLVAISLHDPADHALPELGLVRLEDAETGHTLVLDSTDPALRRAHAAAHQHWHENLAALWQRCGCDHLEAATDTDYLPALHALLRRRRRRR